VVDADGTPLAATVTGANRHDCTQLIPLVDAIPPVRGKPGRPLRRPGAVLADRGYDYDRCRRPLRDRGIVPVIARKGTAHGSGLGKCRYVVERAIALLHQFRRLRTRFEKRGDVHAALLSLGCSVICWRRLANHGYF